MEWFDDLKDRVEQVADDISSGVYNAMVGTMFPVNRTSQSYSQEAFYSWRIFGAPFMMIDDPPLGQVSNSWFMGEWYANQLRQSQILTIKVGSPKYTGNIKGYNTVDWLAGTAQAMNEGQSLWDAVIDITAAGIMSSVNKLDEAKRQYIFYNQYEGYIQHVRLLIISMASYLGVLDYPIPMLSYNKKRFDFDLIRKIDWSTYTTGDNKPPTLQDIFGNTLDSISDFISDKEVETTDGKNFYDIAGGSPAIVQFIVQPTYTTDNFNNQTTQSSASQMASKYAGYGTEVAWLSGASDSGNFVEHVADIISGGAETINTVMENAVHDPSVTIMGSAVVGMIRGLTGERMIFPSIYSNSTYRKDMQYNIHLVSPSGDNYSYFLNIGLPLCYLIAMVAPRLSSTNSYRTPFMIQAYVTGQSAVPMGIVNTMTITRGVTGGINKDGLPLEVDVTLQIEDLYQVMAINPINDPAQFLSNDSLMTYIASYTPIDTWNQSILNSYIYDDIGEFVAEEGLSIQSNLDRIQYNISEYAGNQLKMYNIAATVR